MSAPPLERSYCGEQRMRRDPAVRDGMLSHRCDSVLRETTGALAGPADLSWRKRRQSDKIGSADDLQYPLAKRARYCDTLSLQVMIRGNPSGVVVTRRWPRDGRAKMRTFLGYARDYFFIPRTVSFAALATRNLTTVLAGILIFCCVLGLKPVRAFLFCFTSLPKPGTTNSPVFLVSLYARLPSVSRNTPAVFLSVCAASASAL